jgi:hypothetical protein
VEHYFFLYIFAKVISLLKIKTMLKEIAIAVAVTIVVVLALKKIKIGGDTILH